MGAWRTALLAGLVLVAVAGCSGAAPSGPASSLRADGVGARDPTGSDPRPTASGASASAAFPSTVAGLPVLTVARAGQLLAAGDLDGRVVAVAGYFDQVTPSCPYPGRYIGPLISWCRFAAFTDSAATAQLCQPMGDNGTVCRMPAEGSLAPFLLDETSGVQATAKTGLEPVALVVLGHAGDARQWRCTADTQADCARAFVVDRVAWVAGHEVPLAAPETGDHVSSRAIAPKMSLEQAADAAGVGDSLLTGAAFAARDVATVDPRWTIGGGRTVWLLRSLAAPASGSSTARSATVWLVDDATGSVIGSHPLQLDPGYEPARLWPMATVSGSECCSGNQAVPYDRVASSTGAVLVEGLVSQGASGNELGTTYGSGYEASPIVLSAGTYTITVWLGTYSAGVDGPVRDECSSQVTLKPRGDTAIAAVFPKGRTCSFAAAAVPTSAP